MTPLSPVLILIGLLSLISPPLVYANMVGLAPPHQLLGFLLEFTFITGPLNGLIEFTVLWLLLRKNLTGQWLFKNAIIINLLTFLPTQKLFTFTRYSLFNFVTYRPYDSLVTISILFFVEIFPVTMEYLFYKWRLSKPSNNKSLAHTSNKKLLLSVICANLVTTSLGVLLFI